MQYPTLFDSQVFCKIDGLFMPFEKIFYLIKNKFIDKNTQVRVFCVFKKGLLFMCDCLSSKNVFRMLCCVRNDAKFFLKEDASYFCGLAKTKMHELRKHLIRENFLEEHKREYFLTEKGKEFLNRIFDEETTNEIKFGFRKVYEKTPVIICDALTKEKAPSTLTRAIRLLAKHLLEGCELRKNSTEEFIYRELFDGEASCQSVLLEMENYLLEGGRVFLQDLFEKFMAPPYGLTRSLVSVLLLDILVRNKNIFAIYERHQFQLKFDVLIFDRMMFCPQNFELQKTEMEEIPVLKEISLLILPEPSSNILDLTRGLIYFVRSLEKYTLHTERLSKRTRRFRNVILNAKDPVSLFYRDIPRVLCGKLLKECDSSIVNAFADACKELKGCYDNLISEINGFFFSAFYEFERESLKKRFEEAEEFLYDRELKIMYNNIREDVISNQQWIERIATFVNKSRVPKDWSDEDVSDFKLKIKEMATKFFGIEAVASSCCVLIKDKSVEEILNRIGCLSYAQRMTVLKTLVER